MIPQTKQKSTLPTLLLLLVAIIFGSGYSVAQYLLNCGFNYATILLAQFSIAALMIALAFFKVLRREMRLWMIKGGLALGGILFLALFSQTMGLDLSTPSNNAFILSSNVVLVPFLWWIVTKHRPKKIVFAASFLCLIGLIILSIDYGAGFVLGYGDLLSFLAAILFATHIVVTDILAKKMDYRVLVFLQFFGATLCALAAFIITGGTRSIPNIFAAGNTVGALSALLFMSIFQTYLCFFLQTFAQKFIASSKAAILLSTESVFATLFSLVIGYDSLRWQMLVGGTLICMAVVLPKWAEVHGKKKLSKSDSS